MNFIDSGLEGLEVLSYTDYVCVHSLQLLVLLIQIIFCFIFVCLSLQYTIQIIKVAFLAKLYKLFVHFFHLLSNLNLDVFQGIFDQVFELSILSIKAWQDGCKFIF